MTILDTPVYTLGSWGGNVTDEFGVDWIVTGEEGWSSSPPVRPTSEDKQAADGSWAGPGVYAARVISLVGKALAPNRAAMLHAKDRLKAAITARAPGLLVVAEEHLTRQSLVRLTDQIQITDWGSCAFDWSLILTAADPRRYATTTVELSTTLPSSSESGRTYPRTYPYTYGGGGGSGTVYFTNDGDYDETPATITITGPILNPQIAHVQSGRSLTFGLSLALGEYLAVDLLRRTALLNGMSSRGATITPGSAWWLLRPGLNEIQFRGQALLGEENPPQMTLTAASAWT